MSPVEPVPPTLDPRRLAVRRPWLPESLRTRSGYTEQTVSELSYVQVDEIVGTLVCLAVAPWPQADGHGRLRFDRTEDRGQVVVHRSELHDQLYRGWLRRDPRVGDVFAAVVAPAVLDRLTGGDDVPLDDGCRLVDVLPGPVHDVSREARTVAKLAYYAAAAAPESAADARRLGQDGLAERSGPAPRATTVRIGAWRGAVVPTAPARTDDPPWTVPASLFVDEGPDAFLDDLRAHPDALVYLLLNVGDGDTQLLLLPADRRVPHRRAVVVDVATRGKLLRLLDDLQGHGILPDLDATPGVFPVVVATHPHADHIGGLAELLERYGRRGAIHDVWEPGYYHTGGACVEMMAAVEELDVVLTQPTSGMTRWVGPVKLTVLAPGVGLRARYDSYGVEINDSSIALRVEFPAARIAEELAGRGPRNRSYLRLSSPWALVLGADAQTTSWAQVAVDFPQLHRHYDTPLYTELAAARGRDHLSAQVLKVAHHASKHGINLELVERIGPHVALVSSVGGAGKYNFPHALATDTIREALQATTGSGAQRLTDHDLGIHYTGGTRVDVSGGTQPLGSIALLVPPRRGGRLRMWRFGDRPSERVDLRRGLRATRVRRR